MYGRLAEKQQPRIPALHIVLRDLASMEYASPKNSCLKRSQDGKYDANDTSKGALHCTGHKNKHINASHDIDESSIYFAKYLKEVAYVEKVHMFW